MIQWFSFYLDMIRQLVTLVFSLETGLGFSLGDFEVSLFLICLIGTALIIKVGSSARDAGSVKVERSEDV